MRNLYGDIRDEYQVVLEQGSAKTVLFEIVDIILPFLIQHNSECEAVYLLAEVDSLEKIIDHIDKDNYRASTNIFSPAHYTQWILRRFSRSCKCDTSAISR